ncbi:MAG: flagellar basal body rod protein FlgC [Planctomycetota bacterium]|nr:flagellar basal body rod protein FlgC [Planctomycetota bacterium]
MSVENIRSPIDIAISGLKVQALRMDVIANNIANSNTTRTANGQPYRRQDVLLTTTGGLAGVTIGGLTQDTRGEFKRVLQPGHPDADTNGYVAMPNIDLPVEMMHMVAATRAYEANAAVLKRYQDGVDITLELLK